MNIYVNVGGHFFKLFRLFFKYKYSSACLSDVPDALQDQKDMSEPLKLELMTCLSCHVLGAGTL